MPDQGYGLPVEAPDAAHERRVVGEGAVAVQLDEVVEDPLDVVEVYGRSWWRASSTARQTSSALGSSAIRSI
jgi:hypothetical protein